LVYFLIFLPMSAQSDRCRQFGPLAIGEMEFSGSYGFNGAQRGGYHFMPLTAGAGFVRSRFTLQRSGFLFLFFDSARPSAS
jgi:hypothetical protein